MHNPKVLSHIIAMLLIFMIQTFVIALIVANPAAQLVLIILWCILAGLFWWQYILASREL